MFSALTWAGIRRLNTLGKSFAICTGGIDATWSTVQRAAAAGVIRLGNGSRTQMIGMRPQPSVMVGVAAGVVAAASTTGSGVETGVEVGTGSAAGAGGGAGGRGGAVGVTEIDAADEPDVPPELVAVVVNAYAVPFVKPVNVQLPAEPVTVQVEAPPTGAGDAVTVYEVGTYESRMLPGVPADTVTVACELPATAAGVAGVVGAHVATPISVRPLGAGLVGAGLGKR